MQNELNRMVEDYDGGRLSRRQLIARLTGFVGAAAATAAAWPNQAMTHVQAESKSTFAGTDLNHIALRVTDIDRSRAFYQQHLGLELASQGPRNCFLRCQEKNFVALFKHEKPGLDHFCFSVKKFEAGETVERLKGVGLKPRRRADRVYFDDPDGIEVQLAAKTHGV